MSSDEYVPDYRLPHCRMCGDPRNDHAWTPRRYGALCEKCDCPGYQPKRHVDDWDDRLAGQFV